MDLSVPPGAVVAGIDGSKGSLRAARWAAAEAQIWGLPLCLVHVWSPPVVDWPLPTGAAAFIPENLTSPSPAILDQAEATLRAEADLDGIEVHKVAFQGQAAQHLVATTKGAHALVLGTRGLGGFAGLLLGSVVSACLHHGRSPVVAVGGDLVLPGEAPVVVGVDSSPGSHAALRWAASEAVRQKVLLRVVHGWDPGAVIPPGPQAFGPLDEEEFALAADRFLNALVDDELADMEARPEVECLSVAAPAAEALLWEARNASLLVVGTRGRGGFAGLLLGSVSRQCANYAPCPVAVVPRLS